MSVAYEAAIAALHELGRALERLGSVYAQAALIDATVYRLKFEGLKAILQRCARDERLAADELHKRYTLNMREMRRAANDR